MKGDQALVNELPVYAPPVRHGMLHPAIQRPMIKLMKMGIKGKLSLKLKPKRKKVKVM